MIVNGAAWLGCEVGQRCLYCIYMSTVLIRCGLARHRDESLPHCCFSRCVVVCCVLGYSQGTTRAQRIVPWLYNTLCTALMDESTRPMQPYVKRLLRITTVGHILRSQGECAQVLLSNLAL